jgi:hypothetical protein
VNDGWSLIPGSECDFAFESVWSAGSESALGFGHCWEVVGGDDMGLNTDIGAIGELFDVFSSSYSITSGESSFDVPFTNPHLEPFLTFSATPPTFPSIDDVASSTESTMLQTKQPAQVRQDHLPVAAHSSIQAFLANGLQSGSRLDEGRQSSNLTDIDYQSPLNGNTASSSATIGDLKSPSEPFVGAVRCNFEGCGHVCKDYGSLRYVVPLN